MRFLAASVAVVCALSSTTVAIPQSSREPSPAASLYDPNPKHLWNRLHRQFHVRVAADGSEYGDDAVDPLLWRETRYLLTNPSHDRAVQLLDEFLASQGERLITDPVKRAVFQRDLWAIFDWLASVSEGDQKARQALMPRVARVIRRVALTKTEIARLPDSYAAAMASGTFSERDDPSDPRGFLPRDLFSAGGPWVGIGGMERIVPHHAAELSRSAFTVLWSLPGGSKETSAYLQKLWDFPEPFVPDDSFQLARDGERRVVLNPALPPIPDGTRVALVRKMLLIDAAGVIAPTNVIETIQLRTFPKRETFFELTFSRRRLFAGQAGGLRTVAVGERDFITFSAQGMDLFEHAENVRSDITSRLPRVLEGCINCHHVGVEPTVQTVQSLRHFLRPSALADSRHERWSKWFSQGVMAAQAKSGSYEWGVLQALWQSQPR
jgi:hypothetical protein